MGYIEALNAELGWLRQQRVPNPARIEQVETELARVAPDAETAAPAETVVEASAEPPAEEAPAVIPPESAEPAPEFETARPAELETVVPDKPKRAPAKKKA